MVDRNTPLGRQINAVHEALEVSNNKLAIKLCSRKELARANIGKALKAYALHESGKVYEAFTICQELVNEFKEMKAKKQKAPVQDDGSLQFLPTVLAKTGHYSLCLQCDLLGLDLFPENTDFLTSLFFKYYNVKDFSKMQLTAMKLTKALGNDAFLMYAATTLLIAVQNGDTEATVETNKKKLLLVEMLIQKRIQSLAKGNDLQKEITKGRFITEQLLQVYILGQKYDDALQLVDQRLEESKEAFSLDHIDGEEKEKHIAAAHPLTKRELLTYKAEILQAREDYEEASKLFLQLLRSVNADDWRFWTGYLETKFFHLVVTYLGEASPTPWTEQASQDLDNDFLSVLDTFSSASSAKTSRGPELARISYFFRKILFLIAYGAKSQTDDKGYLVLLEPTVNKFVDEMCSYVSKFSRKPSCFGDLRNFLLPFVRKTTTKKSTAVKDFLADTPAFPPPMETIYVHKLGLELSQREILRRQQKRWDFGVYGGFLAPFQEAFGRLIEKVSTTRASASALILSPTEVEGSRVLNALKEYTLCEQLLRFLGFQDLTPMNKQGLQEAASQNLQLYCKVVKLVKTSEIEIQPFDDLLILTVHLLLQFYEQGSSTERFSFLLIISSILETGLQHSPHSFQIKALLMEVYERLGSIKQFEKQFSGLGINYTQYISLSYVGLSGFVRTGSSEQVLKLGLKVLDFKQNSLRQSSNYLRSALQNGNYMKAVELSKLEQLISSSHQVYSAKVVHFLFLLSSLLQAGDGFKVIEKLLVAEYEGYFETCGEKPLFTDDDEVPCQTTTLKSFRAPFQVKKCVRNYDMSFKCCWDFCNTSTEAGSDIKGGEHLVFSSYNRGFASEALYDKWVETADLWTGMVVEVSFLLYLLTTRGKAVQQHLGEESRKISLTLRTMLMRLGLIELADEETTSVEGAGYWKAFYASIEVSTSIMSTFLASVEQEQENDLMLLHIRCDKLLQLLASLQGSFASELSQISKTKGLALLQPTALEFQFVPRKKKGSSQVSEGDDFSIEKACDKLRNLKAALQCLLKAKIEVLQTLIQMMKGSFVQDTLTPALQEARDGWASAFSFTGVFEAEKLRSVQEQILAGTIESYSMSLTNLEKLVTALRKLLSSFRL